MRRRLLTALVALLGLAGLFVTYGQGQPARAQGGEEQAFVQRINELRASKGLRTLTVDPYLTDLSRTWASAMRADGRISHAPDITAGVTVEWLKIGENVGVGGDVDALFDAFVASPTHYENLVDPLFTRIGVGVVWDGQVMYTTHRFMAMANGDPGAPATTAPPTTAPPTTAAPTTTTAPPTTTTTAPTRDPAELEAARTATLLQALRDAGR